MIPMQQLQMYADGLIVIKCHILLLETQTFKSCSLQRYAVM